MILKTIAIGMMIVMICIIVQHIRQEQQNDPQQQQQQQQQQQTPPQIFRMLGIDQSASLLSSLTSSLPSSIIRHYWNHIRSSNSTPSPKITFTMNHVNISIINIDNLTLSSRKSATTTTIDGHRLIKNRSSSKRNRMMKETSTSFVTFLWDRIRSIFCIKCLLSYLFPNRQVHSNSPITKLILDSIASVRDTKFNDRFYNAMEQCMNDTYIPILASNMNTADKIDSNITIVNSTVMMIPFKKLTDDVWLKFLQIAIQNDTDDPWGVGSSSQWLEWNPTFISVNVTTSNNNITSSNNINSSSNNLIRFPILEPCNTVSNFAFYRSMIVIWNLNNYIPNDNNKLIVDRSSSWYVVPTNYRIAFINTFGLLSWGSALYHASNTNIGRTCDTIFISILSYTAYQMAIESIPYNPILHGIITSTTATESTNETNYQFTTRKKALDALKQMNTILYEQPIKNWKMSIDDVVSNVPQYFMTFSVMVSAILNLTLPMTIAKQVTQFLGELILSDNTQLDYVNNIFQPLFRQSITEDKLNNIRFRDRIILFLRFSGTLIKMIWALIWQESIFRGFHLQNLFLNRLGATITPIINQLANTISGYDRSSFKFDQHFQTSNGVYPDNKRCNMLQPHSKWHEISANALIDLLLLGSDAKNIIDGGSLIIMDNNDVHNHQLNSSSDGNDPLENVFNMEDHDIVCDENMNFLLCVLKYGMSGFDMMDKIKDINSDPTAVAITNCFNHVLQYLTNNNKDGSSFNNCFISSFKTASTSTLSTNTTTQENDFFDQYLFLNDCIVFTSMWTIDLQRLSKCIQTISDDTTSCQKHLTEPFQLEQCFNVCESDVNVICINECITRYSKQLSPSYEQTISSILLLLDPNHPDRSNLLDTVLLSSSSSLRESLSSPLTVMHVFISGIAELTKCSLIGPCRTSYNRFLKATNDIQECSSKCYLDRKDIKDPFPFLKLPKGIKCWLGCYILS